MPDVPDDMFLCSANGQGVKPHLSEGVISHLIIAPNVQYYYLEGISDIVQQTIGAFNHKIMYWNSIVVGKSGNRNEITAFTFCTRECETNISHKLIFLGSICNREKFTCIQSYVYNTDRGCVEQVPGSKFRESRDVKPVEKSVSEILKGKVKNIIELWDNKSGGTPNKAHVSAAVQDDALHVKTTSRLCKKTSNIVEKKKFTKKTSKENVPSSSKSNSAKPNSKVMVTKKSLRNVIAMTCMGDDDTPRVDEIKSRSRASNGDYDTPREGVLKGKPRVSKCDDDTPRGDVLASRSRIREKRTMSEESRFGFTFLFCVP